MARLMKAVARDIAKDLTSRLNIGRKQESDIEQRELDDLDEVDLKTIKSLEKKGVRVIYPNLKYRKPKYHNVSEVLKYVESDKQTGEGVKLVIMNFND